MAQLFDVRAGEARGPVLGLAGVLLFIIGAHTILETARDTLLLAGPGPRALGAVYVAIAAGTIPGAALAARAGERLGQRRALAISLGVAIVGPTLLFLAPATHAAAMATYVLSGILSSVVVPQFWLLVGTLLTVGQGRRLFGLISAGGVLGGIAGPAAASGMLVFLPVRHLLLLSSLVFAVALVAVSFVRAPERASEPQSPRREPRLGLLRAFRETPYLTRVALVVFLSTATFLALDYLFKSSLARAVPTRDLGRFFAHYYFALNVLSLLVQLASGTIVRRLGVLAALVPTPLLLIAGALTALLGGGALPGVLVVKSIDGSLRYSLHRVTGELMYLPLPLSTRQRTKTLIDGGLGRIAQTVTGAGLLAIGGTTFIGPGPLAAIVAALGVAWLATVVTMRRPYLRLLRSSITTGSFDASDNPEPVDLETAQMLVQCLASDDASLVEGAMRALARRGREGLVPALVLLHQDEVVLEQALEMFGRSSRSDWFALARRLLDDPRESVRVAAARALARHEQLDPASLAHDVGWRARGYAAVRLALRDASTEVAEHPSVAHLLAQPGEPGDLARMGLLAAISDATPTLRLSPLLCLLAGEARTYRERSELLARAAAHQGDPTLIPYLIPLLEQRDGREAVRDALVSFREPALAQVVAALRDPSRSRRLRLHAPKTLARFATSYAAECLLTDIETEPDGLIRYKAIRALRVLVTEHRLFVDRRRAERLSSAELWRHFTHLGLRSALERPTDPLAVLAVELLDERAAHALERAFHLLQIAHPRQGVHHAYIARRSDDPFARANAAELIDALLRRRDQRMLRRLFRLATDDLPIPDRVERARALDLPAPRTRDEAIDALVDDGDTIFSVLGRRLRAGTCPPGARERARAEGD